MSERIVGNIEAKALDGSISIDGQSPIRRTCNLTLALNDNQFLPKEDGFVWVNRKFRVWCGIKNMITDEIRWFNRGIFILSDPNINYEPTNRTIQIQGVDKMALLNGKLGGQLGYKTTLSAGTPISSIIQSTIVQLGKENKYKIELTSYTLPYDVEKTATDTIWSILEEIRDLYRTYQCYYDINGNFIYEKQKTLLNDQIKFDFSQYPELITKYNSQPNFDVKNHIVIWGKANDDGTQAKGEALNANSGKFAISRIGEKLFVDNNDKLYTNEQCQSQADYDLQIKCNFQDKLNLSCVNIYLLDVNELVYVENAEAGIEGAKYCIDKINHNLNKSGVMDLELHRIYE